MENLPEFNSDRRDFFRINDLVFIEAKPLKNTEAGELVSSIKNPSPDDHESQVKNQLSTIQSSLNHIIEQINHNDRELARALRLLDEKINIVSHAVQRQQSSAEEHSLVEANLSGGGIGFMSEEEYERRSMLDLRIELQPSGAIIRVVAHVIACSKKDGAPEGRPYYLRLAFTHMSEYDRNFLVKHTLSRQAAMLRTGVDISA